MLILNYFQCNNFINGSNVINLTLRNKMLVLSAQLQYIAKGVFLITFENYYNWKSLGMEDRSIQLLITKNVVTTHSCQHITYLIICHSVTTYTTYL